MISAIEAGDDAKYLIGLISQPEKEVNITVSELQLPHDTNANGVKQIKSISSIDGGSSQITFTRDNWYIPQEMSIEALADKTIEDGGYVDKTDANSNANNSNRKGEDKVLDLLTYNKQGELAGSDQAKNNPQQNGFQPAARYKSSLDCRELA